MEIVTIQDVRLLHWAEQQLGETWDASKVRWLSGVGGGICFVVIYSRFTKRDCWMSIATDGKKRWATRASLRAMFALPFEQWGLKRLTFMVRADNELSLKMMRQAGAVEEGRARKCFDGGVDGIAFGMLPDECRYWSKS